MVWLSWLQLLMPRTWVQLQIHDIYKHDRTVKCVTRPVYRRDVKMSDREVKKNKLHK